MSINDQAARPGAAVAAAAEPTDCFGASDSPALHPSLKPPPSSLARTAVDHSPHLARAVAAAGDQPEHIAFPPRIASLMYPSPQPSACGLATADTAAIHSRHVGQVSAAGVVACGGVLRGSDANVQVAQIAGLVHAHENKYNGNGGSGTGAKEHSEPSLPMVPTGGPGQTQPDPPLAHTLSTSFLSWPESVDLADDDHHQCPTRSPAPAARVPVPLSSSHASISVPRASIAIGNDAFCSPQTTMHKTRGTHDDLSQVSEAPEVYANVTDPPSRNAKAPVQPCAKAPVAAAATTANGPPAGASDNRPLSPSSGTLFHRAASFLGKLTGNSSSSHSESIASARPQSRLRRRPSLPASSKSAAGRPVMIGSLPTDGAGPDNSPRTPSLPLDSRSKLSSSPSALPAASSSPAHVHDAITSAHRRFNPIPLTISHTHPQSASHNHATSSVASSGSATSANSPHLSIHSAPPAVLTAHMPDPTDTSDGSLLPPPPTSPRPSSIRSVTSTASKRAPSIKVPAKKRFGWSRRFFRFKDRVSSPLVIPSPSPSTAAFGLHPITDEADSGDAPFFTCTKHGAASSKSRLAENASPTCCIASPRLAMNAIASAAGSSSDLSCRPLLTAGPPLRPSTPSADDTCPPDPPTLAPANLDFPPTNPDSDTPSIRRSRPSLASPNPTSISRSTSLASTSVSRRQPRLERVHAEDRHDPTALTHRFQLVLSAAASDILVRNYRKSPRALVVALYSATLLQDLDGVGKDTDSGNGVEVAEARTGEGETTELLDGMPRGGPSFLCQFQELLLHSAVPHQLLFPPGTVVPTTGLSSATHSPLHRHTAIIHADFGLVTPPVSPMTPPPPLGPVQSTPTTTSSATASTTTFTKPSKPIATSSTDTYTLKVAHMLLTHHLASACLSVIQSIDRPTLLSVLARPRDRVPKLVLQCPSAPAPAPAPHHRRASTAASFRAIDRATLAVQSAIDLAARVLHARFVECARLRCPPRSKRRGIPAASSSAFPSVSNPLAYLYTCVLRGVRLMAYVSAADRDLRWTWAGRDARVRVPGMCAAMHAGEWEGIPDRNASVLFSVFPGLVLVTDNAFDPVVVPVLVPGDVRRGVAGAETMSGSASDMDDDDDDNVPLWSLPVRPPSPSGSSTGSTATVHSLSVASRCGSRAPSVGTDIGDDDDEGMVRGRIVVDEQVFVIPNTTNAGDVVGRELRASPVVGVETARRRAPGSRVFPGVDGWLQDRDGVGTRPATMPVFPVTVDAAVDGGHGLVCRTPSPALTHRLSFGSDTTVVIGDGSSETETSDTEPDFADADDMGGWIDIGAAESFESSMSLSMGVSQPAGMAATDANGWVASPMRPSTATAMLREALALEWRDMLP